MSNYKIIKISENNNCINMETFLKKQTLSLKIMLFNIFVLNIFDTFLHSLWAPYIHRNGKDYVLYGILYMGQYGIH